MPCCQLIFNKGFYLNFGIAIVMFQMLRIGSYLSSLIFIFLGKPLYAKPSEFINNIELGFSEKGPNINLIKNISDKNQITFGLHYFEGNISSVGYSLDVKLVSNGSCNLLIVYKVN